MEVKKTVRKIDELGRIVIPKDMRKQLDWHDLDLIEISEQGNSIALEKEVPSCILCGEKEQLYDFHGKKICASCMREIASTTK